ncbi:MAG: helix-turn-helix transcriptional regulator [Dysosmobacter sp.]|jgi:transcriptional regulator with XRE-family HTH domain
MPITEKGVENIKTRLKEIREKKGLTQEELSAKSGVSRTIISYLENDRTECVMTSTLTKLADALGEKVTTIFF